VLIPPFLAAKNVNIWAVLFIFEDRGHRTHSHNLIALKDLLKER